MATLQDYRNERLRKRQELLNLGYELYPSKVQRTHQIAKVVSDFSDLEGKEVVLAGRISRIRKFGQIAFLVLKDFSGEIQLFLKKNELQKADVEQGLLDMATLRLLDVGDFVEVTGKVGKTQTGEISVFVEKIRLLVKTLRPLPEELTNKEERLRRRYLDISLNQEVRDRYLRRSKFWQATRDFLNARGFSEINTSVLEHTTGGADANPFMTHMDALNEDFYLRISHELPLKRLIGAGYEKVYDIGQRFRNENYSDEHLPEHVAMEWYWAYANWQDGMKMMEEMYRYVLMQTFGKLKFQLGQFEVDMSKQWETWDYTSTLNQHYQIDIFGASLEELKQVLTKHKLEVEKADNRARIIDKLWKNIRKNVAGPIWLVNTPKFISPLSKTNRQDSRLTERFQPVIAGSELGNGFSELNDPIDQLERFLEQQKMREAGDEEAMMLDIDFVEMLEYGMPPTCGWGYSERVFWVFEGVTAREGVPFPQLRRYVDPVTRKIYPQIKFDID